MKKTLIVLFLIAMVISTTQTFRHVYVKWVHPQGSVLDEFRNQTQSDIAGAKSMDELVELYREARREVDAHEADPDKDEMEPHYRMQEEPYLSANQIRSEITAREHDKRQLFKLFFYWFCGLLSIFIGIFSFRRINPWLGLSGIIVGFTEMLCWTSPLFHNRLMYQQFEYLLNYKLLFSLITWILLIGLWLLVEKRNLLQEKPI